MTSRRLGAALIALVLAAGVGYVAWRGSAAESQPAASGLDLARAGAVLYVDPAHRVRQATRGGAPLGSGPRCHRAHAAAGVLACLRGRGPDFASEILVYDSRLRPRKRLPLWGNPSRVRVSPSGNLIAWTVFREGDSYLAPGGFSTTAGIYHRKTGAHYGSLEDFTVLVEGRRRQPEDRNFWGITFATDDRTFYATMSSGGRTWLMRGDLTRRALTALRRNVECPSLSPDGARVAYKKRSGDRWRLHVLNLASGRDIPLAEPDHVDDQPAWLDADTVGYAKPHRGGPAIFTVPADGGGAPRRWRAGSSPAVL